MTLKELVQNLTTTNAQLVLIDLLTGVELANMKASGYESLDSDIKNSEVKRWALVGGNIPTIKVTLEYTEPEPTTTTEE